MIPIDEIGDPVSMARAHSEADIARLAESLKAFGWTRPVLLDAANNVIAGNAVIAAARRLGMDTVPALRLSDLSEDEAALYAIADNKHAENACWDKPQLAIELKTSVSLNATISLRAIGYDIAPYEGLLRSQEAGSSKADRIDAAMLAGPSVARFGEVWALGSHRILCGEATDGAGVTAFLNGEAPQMIFTDPPYNVPIDGHVSGNGAVKHASFANGAGEMSDQEFWKFLYGSFKTTYDLSKPGALIYVCMDWRGLSALWEISKTGAFGERFNMAVWVKPNGGMGSMYRSQHEHVVIFKKPGAAHVNNIQLGRNGRNRTNVWEYAPIANAAKVKDPKLRIHPTMKPVAMVEDAILDATHPKDVVVDMFLGSGTALLAAEGVGRRCFGVEIDPMYVDLAIRRWQALTGRAAVLESSGRTFGDLEAARAPAAGTAGAQR